MGYRSKEPSEETQQKAERLLSILQTTFKGKEMKTTFKDIKEIRKGYHKMPDGTIMKDSDHPKKEEEELEERVKASDATRAKLHKPYDSSAKRATKVKVKNAISDLDHIAWQFENQFDTGDGNRGKHLVIQKKVTQRVDSIMKELQSLERIL